MPAQRTHAIASVLAASLILAACAPAATPTSQPVAQQPAATTAPAATATAAPTATTAPTADPKADWPEKFVIGMFGGDDAEQLLIDKEPLRAYIEAELGIPVMIQTGTSYSAVIEAMRAKRVDAMQVGPFSYTLAVQEANAEALVVSVGTTKDPGPFQSPTRQPIT